jgi:hypothetical protein
MILVFGSGWKRYSEEAVKGGGQKQWLEGVVVVCYDLQNEEGFKGAVKGADSRICPLDCFATTRVI